MREIVLVSASADCQSVQAILDAAIEQRLDIWHSTLDRLDRKSLANCRVEIARAHIVILVWSFETAGDEAETYLKLATTALKTKKVINVRIDDVDPPDLLRDEPTYNLTGWRVHPGAIRRFFGGGLYLTDVMAALRAMLAGRNLKIASASKRMLVRQALLLVPVIASGIALAPTLIGLANDLGWMNLPSAAEANAWRKLDGSCDALRSFLRAYPGGHYAREGQARLDGRRMTTVRAWQPFDRDLPIYLSLSETPVALAEDSARTAARQKARKLAETECARLAQAGASRVLVTKLGSGSLACERGDKGFQCTFDGMAVCRLSEPRDIMQESCGAN